MKSKITFKVIAHDSDDYKDAIKLREGILRKPFGLHFSEDELLAEKNYIQIVGLRDLEVIATAVLVPEAEYCKMQRVVVKIELTCRDDMTPFYDQFGFSKDYGTTIPMRRLNANSTKD